MKNSPIKTKHRVVNMAIFAVAFMVVPLIFTSLVEKFAPVEYFVDVQSLEVGDMQKGLWQQQVSLTRKVKRNLYGSTFQELRLTKEIDADTTFYYQTRKTDAPVLFEHQEDNNVSFVRDWSAEVERINPVTGEYEQLPRVPEKVLNQLEVGEQYYWTWVFEFETTKNRTDIVQVRSNSFTVLAPPAVTEIKVEAAENVIIEQ